MITYHALMYYNNTWIPPQSYSATGYVILSSNLIYYENNSTQQIEFLDLNSTKLKSLISNKTKDSNTRLIIILILVLILGLTVIGFAAYYRYHKRRLRTNQHALLLQNVDDNFP